MYSNEISYNTNINGGGLKNQFINNVEGTCDSMNIIYSTR